MTRYQDWPSRLDAYLRACANDAFVWGECDCCQFANGALRAMTGTDVLATLTVAYAGQRGALRVLATLGPDVHQAVQAIAAPLGLVSVAPPCAQRGDLLVIQSGRDGLDGQAAAVVGLEGLPITVGQHGLVTMPRTTILAAWAV